MDDFTPKAGSKRKRGHEESARRLDTLSPQLRDAVAKAIESGRIDLTAFGMTKQKSLDGLQAGTDKLEAIGIEAPALEALVKLVGRPPLVVRNDQVELQPLDTLPPGTDTKIKAVEWAVPSVGRVEFFNHAMSWGGTGWVLKRTADSCTVVTNRHVAKLVARRTADGSGVFLRSPFTGMRYAASVDFNEEADAHQEDARAAPVIAIPFVAEDFAPDAALMTLRLPDGAGWTMPDELPLAEREGEVDEIVAVIGYPARDSRSEQSDDSVAALDRYFSGLYEVKRFAPGVLTNSVKDTGLIRYDCTTLGGNSGSPVMSLDQKAVVGLHFAGVYGVENTAVGLATLQALRDSDGRTLSVGASLHTEAAGEAKDGIHQPSDLMHRDGYDPGFLGGKFTAPWPILPASIEATLATPSDAKPDRPNELRFTHFGVKFSAARKLPVVTAVNIDGENSVSIKRGNDRWFFDARIPLALQHGEKDYADRKIDRGHMVRREDPNWGPDAEQANFDTFHYVNSAPQHSELNQGKTLWQGLENYILDSARTSGFKACVFTGPVFGEEDPDVGGIITPLEFWKVVAMVDAGKERLHATAYLLSQGELIRKLLEERGRSEAREGGLLLGPYRTFQIMVKDLGAALNYNFGPLVDADPLAHRGEITEAIRLGQPVVFELTSEADLVL